MKKLETQFTASKCAATSATWGTTPGSTLGWNLTYASRSLLKHPTQPFGSKPGDGPALGSTCNEKATHQLLKRRIELGVWMQSERGKLVFNAPLWVDIQPPGDCRFSSCLTICQGSMFWVLIFDQPIVSQKFLCMEPSHSCARRRVASGSSWAGS